MNYIYSHLFQIFISCGGIGLVIGAATKGVKPAIHWGIQQALLNPKYKSILIQYRSQIEAFFDSVDEQIKEDLDQAR